MATSCVTYQMMVKAQCPTLAHLKRLSVGACHLDNWGLCQNIHTKAADIGFTGADWVMIASFEEIERKTQEEYEECYIDLMTFLFYAVDGQGKVEWKVYSFRKQDEKIPLLPVPVVSKPEYGTAAFPN